MDRELTAPVGSTSFTSLGETPAILPLVKWPSKSLSALAEEVLEVTPEIEQLCKNMLLTMMVHKGVGLAAPQVGKALRIFVMDLGYSDAIGQADPRVFINPVWEPMPEAILEDGVEGCLSVPGIGKHMKRQSAIYLSATQLDGTRFERQPVFGFEARVIQHEIDHLNGVTIGHAFSRLEHREYQKIQRKMKG